MRVYGLPTESTLIFRLGPTHFYDTFRGIYLDTLFLPFIVVSDVWGIIILTKKLNVTLQV